MTGTERSQRRPSEPSPDPVLEVRDLVVEFGHGAHAVRSVDRVSWSTSAGSALGIVGESGCGKSVTALSILRLIRPPGRIVSGSIRYHDEELLALPEPRMRALRGNRLAMIFQEPMTALNPVYTIGAQIAEVLRAHRVATDSGPITRRAALDRAVELLGKVGIADPARRVRDYPHRMSGGMRQRVMIAMALCCHPEVLIADEPTTALDVTLQAEILALLTALRRELGMTLILITHDLGIVAETCDTVAVMYAGQVVEQASAAELFAQPAHPYTAGLLRALPSFDPQPTAAGAGHRLPLQEIPGLVPRLDQLPEGCRFQDRCAHASATCRSESPTLQPLTPGHDVRCFHPLTGPAAAPGAAP